MCNQLPDTARRELVQLAATTLLQLYGIPLLEQAKHQAGPTLFVVVTDDIAWARLNLDFSDLAVAFLVVRAVSFGLLGISSSDCVR